MSALQEILRTEWSKGGTLQVGRQVLLPGETSLDVRISGPAAYVRSEQIFTIPDVGDEASYSFPVPPRAALHAATCEVGDGAPAPIVTAALSRVLQSRYDAIELAIANGDVEAVLEIMTFPYVSEGKVWATTREEKRAEFLAAYRALGPRSKSSYRQEVLKVTALGSDRAEVRARSVTRIRGRIRGHEWVAESTDAWVRQDGVWRICGEKDNKEISERELVEGEDHPHPDPRPTLELLVGRPEPSQRVGVRVEYAQELEWLGHSQLELRFPTPGRVRGTIELDRPGDYSEIESSHALQLIGKRLIVTPDERGDFLLRLRMREGWPQPILLSNGGCFLLSLRAPLRAEDEDDPMLQLWGRSSPAVSHLQWTDRGFGIAPEGSEWDSRVLQACPLTLYGRHRGEGELEVEGRMCNAGWRAVLQAEACDNPAIPLLWARKRIGELEACAGDLCLHPENQP